MKKIKALIQTHPYRAMFVLCTSLLIILAILLTLLSSREALEPPVSYTITPISFVNGVVSSPTTDVDIEDNDSQTVPDDNSQAENVPEEEREYINPITNTYSGYPSYPVGTVVCNPDENVFTNDYYSFCYPSTYTIDAGSQGNLSGNSYLTLTNPSDSSAMPVIFERVDGNLALSKQNFVGGFTKEEGYHDFDLTGNVMRELDASNATEISFASIGNYKGTLLSFTYTLKSSIANTFFSSFSTIPDEDRTTLFFINGDSNYIMLYQPDTVSNRLLDSLVFNR